MPARGFGNSDQETFMSPKLLTLAAAAAIFLGSPALAQEHSMGHSTLPEICNPGGTMPDSMMMETEMPEGMGEAHQALNAGMSKMNADMSMGMMAEDIDVAFVCSMIPHHQGAIDMARAELDHGDDPWAREMAEKVIAAQEQEIKDMLDWLAQQAK
jgi:uncharacterized protein (DUF305 family)